MRRIVVVSSSRADLSILRALLAGLCKDKQLSVTVLATGMHCDDETFLRATVPAGADIAIVGANLGNGPVGAAASMAAIVADAARALHRIAPDLLIVSGDRLDMMPVALAAVPLNVPMMHLHGGDLTYGAVDDRLRHAITKLAHVHCAASPAAADRIRRMGEEPWRVHVTGSPAMDTLLDVPEIDRAALARALGVAEAGALRLVTVHPETNAAEPLAPARAVLAALEALDASPTLFTAPNADPGGSMIAQLIADFVSVHAWARMIDTLGTEVYANAMRHAAVMIGNSSSGLIEAGLFDLPVVNVGDRQAGREHGDNVVTVPADPGAIVTAVNGFRHRPRRKRGTTPYGDGRAVERVVTVIKSLPERQVLLRKQWPADEPSDAVDRSVRAKAAR